MGTSFGAGSVVSFSNSHITAANLLVISATSLTFDMVVAGNPSDESSAPVDVTVTTGGQVATGTGLITIGA